MFDSPFWQTFPDRLRQPATIATFGSLLAHGAFFAIFPVITASSTAETDNQRIVSVVDLSPQERSRLPPSAITSQVPLPLIKTQQGGAIAPSLGSSSIFLNPSDPYQLPNSRLGTAFLPDLSNQGNSSPFSRSTTTTTVSPTLSSTQIDQQKKQAEIDQQKKQVEIDKQKKQAEIDQQKKQAEIDQQKKQTELDQQNRQTQISQQNQEYQYDRTWVKANLADGVTWLNQVYSKIPEDQRGAPNPKNEPLQVSYDLLITLDPPPKRAIVQMIISLKDNEKKVQFNFIQKTGYAKLDDAAVKRVEEEAIKFIQEKKDKNEVVQPYEILIRGVEFIPKTTAQS